MDILRPDILRVYGFPITFMLLTISFRVLSRPNPNLREQLQIAIQLCMLSVSAHIGLALIVVSKIKTIAGSNDKMTTALEQLIMWAIIFLLVTAICAGIKRMLLLKFPKTEFIWADLFGIITLCLGMQNLMRISAKYALF